VDFRRKPVEPAPGLGPARHLDTLQQRAKGHALRHGSDQRAARKGCIPETPVLRITPPIFKRDAPEQKAPRQAIISGEVAGSTAA
jgi:hypothetical protein